MAQTIIDSTTQQFLDIHDITNDMVIMKNGTAAVMIAVDAMNFGLLAEEEQDAVMYAYAGLLNSLNYPIQIVIRSQTKDVTGYLSLLKEQEDKAATRQNQTRIARYREFVANLIHDRNVLDKKFYVVIPATSLELGFLSAQSVVPGSKVFDITSVEKTVIIEKARNLLEPKRDHIISQFARIGLYSRQLTTQEIIQLFYVSYNPEATEGQGIDESRSYTTPLVQASVEGPTMINATPTVPGTNQSPDMAGSAPTATPTTMPTAAPSTMPSNDVTTTPAPMGPSITTPSATPDVSVAANVPGVSSTPTETAVPTPPTMSPPQPINSTPLPAMDAASPAVASNPTPEPLVADMQNVINSAASSIAPTDVPAPATSTQLPTQPPTEL